VSFSKERLILSKNSSAMVPVHLTLEMAAARHSVALWFLRKALWAGTLKATKAGRRYLVSIKDLDTFFEQLNITMPARSKPRSKPHGHQEAKGMSPLKGEQQ
jgi:hypothetical protein